MRSVALTLVTLAVWTAQGAPPVPIWLDPEGAVLRSGLLERRIRFDGGNVRTTSLQVGGSELLAEAAREFSVVFTREASNRRPPALRRAEAGEKAYFTGGGPIRWQGEGYDSRRYDDPRPNAPRWIDPKTLHAGAWSALVEKPETAVSRPEPGATRLTIRGRIDKDPMLAGVSIELNYEVYEGHPAVRKWAAVRNGGANWLRMERMVIDNLRLVPLTRKPLAAALFGVQPSVVAFEGPGSRLGLIAASEVPSALRWMSDSGAMGYTAALFEWVLGPGEEFVSEPVFYYGFAGPVRETVSAASLPLDRAVEGPYLEFLKQRIGVAAEKAPLHGPQWMTWAYFYDKIDDRLVRQLARIASRSGFTEMLLDDGWQKGRLGLDPDTAKFPDFAATAEFVRSQGMAFGLWVSCFRDQDARDLRDMPDAPSLPLLARSPTLPGLAMSFSSRWRHYYVKDLVETLRRYRATYVKQDFTNIMFGDLAEGHDSRTRRESLLRGLRGLLEAQAGLRRAAPEVVNEMTHEIYWGTPGVPADLAALKHAARFHIPPNECVGCDLGRPFPELFPGRATTAAQHGEALRAGCWLARQRFYSHRGLPVYPLEFYGAATTNLEGSLTAGIQDRQIASWLMGVPVCFSGDSRTLTEENISHYRNRFQTLARLEKDYGIYRRFQFSGVPEPTDVGWHWWGKLDERGRGAVVVLRGSGGPETAAVNVPWVRAASSYRVRGLFSGKDYGVAAGKVLQEKGLAISLPRYGQDLLELDLAPEPARAPRAATP